MSLFLNSFSQNSKSESIADSLSTMHSASLNIYKNNAKTSFSDKVHLSFQTGLSIYSFGKNSFSDKWIAPSISYNATSKLQFSVGAVAMFSKPNYLQYSFNKEAVNTQKLNTGAGQYLLFAQGKYLLSSRITLRGMILREVPNNPINPYALNINHVGVDFKLSDNFSISADYIMIKGNNSSLMGNNAEFNFPSSPLNRGFSGRTW